jgi:UPF0755 protein
MKIIISVILILSVSFVFSSCLGKNQILKTDSLLKTSSMQSQIELSSSEVIDSTPYSTIIKSSSNILSSKPNSISNSSAKPPQSSSAVPVKTIVNVTIPEGFTVFDIGKKLEDSGVCKKLDFLSAVNSYDYSSYSVTNSIDNVANRYYKLEGYLYPSTYQFYKNTKPSEVITKILNTTQSKISSKYIYTGMTTDQIITLASIIQEEVSRYDDMVNVSAVLHNRLKIKMILQVDCTTLYLTKYFPSELIDKYKYFYSTKPDRCLALPIGPICSPGALALQAAVSPSNTEYLYFRSDSSGYYSFSKTQIADPSLSIVS